MIDKVIIAEDHEFANLSVQKTMDDLKVKQYDYDEIQAAKLFEASKVSKCFETS